MSKPKLSVELVPPSSWGVNLRSILTKNQWDVIRRGVYRKVGYTCEVCGGVGKTHPVECHEEWEYNDTTHTQTLVGVKALCPDCHSVKHLGLAATLGKAEYTKKHLMKVNGWGVSEANKYIKGVWKKFEERSQHPWDVVVDWVYTNKEKVREEEEMAKGKEKTKVSVFDLAPKLSERFQGLILERNRIAGIEKGVKEEKKTVNVDLEEAFTHIDNDTSVVWDGFGSVGIVESTRSSINKDLLKEELLRIGLGVDQIVSIVEKSTKVSAFVSVKFTPAKK
jgi:hypothetical protein